MTEKIIYREVKEKDSKQYFGLYEKVMEELKRNGKPEFFLPPQTFFDNLFDENYARNIGAFDGKIMVGIVSLCITQEKVQEYKKILGMIDKKVCEFGNALLLPEYRGKGIVQTLNQKMIDLAKELQYEIAVATVHPDNIASRKVIEKIMICSGDTSIQGHPRLLFKKELLDDQ